MTAEVAIGHAEALHKKVFTFVPAHFCLSQHSQTLQPLLPPPTGAGALAKSDLLQHAARWGQFLLLLNAPPSPAESALWMQHSLQSADRNDWVHAGLFGQTLPPWLVNPCPPIHLCCPLPLNPPSPSTPLCSC